MKEKPQRKPYIGASRFYPARAVESTGTGPPGAEGIRAARRGGPAVVVARRPPGPQPPAGAGRQVGVASSYQLSSPQFPTVFLYAWRFSLQRSWIYDRQLSRCPSVTPVCG
jgi:hypothetical protein